MYVSIRAVALRAVRHSDKHSILSVWTAEQGRLALLLSNASTPEARRRRALCMPLALFEAEVNIIPGREILPMRDVRPTLLTHNTASHPVRSALAMFFAEVLTRLLRESGNADTAMYDLITAMVRDIDTLPERRLANLHILYLYRLAVVLGIAPDTDSWHPGALFSLTTGTFSASGRYAAKDEKVLDPAGSRLVWILGRLTRHNMHRLTMSRAERSEMLDTILSYYTQHLTTMNGLRSLSVLTALSD